MPRIAYVNGRYLPHGDAAVHIEDRGFQFADSVYEMIAVIDGHLPDEQGHLDRLFRSLGELRIAPPMPRRALQLVIREFIRRNRLKNGALYMQVTRGAAARDFKFPDGVKSTLVMTIRPASFDASERKLIAKKAVTVPDIRWKRRDIKSTALVAQVMAKQAAVDRGAYEAWMVDDRGFITEASSSNAWIVDKNNRLITRPPQNNMILKGVTRNALQALCRRENITLVERPFTAAEAYQAREAFTTAAVSLVVPIVDIDGHKIGSGKIGALTAKIFDLYMVYALNTKQKQEKWSPL
jgi:D-alanine transaminase